MTPSGSPGLICPYGGWSGVYARESLEWGACLVSSRKLLNREVQEFTTDDQRLAGLLRLRRLTATHSS
jgi:hypothetical protein